MSDLGVLGLPMQTIKQPAGSGMCAVCVAAMIARTEPEHVYDFLNDGRCIGDPITDAELFIYLMSRGIIPCTAWQVNSPDYSVPAVLRFRYNRASLSIELAEHTAYLSVRSQNYPGHGHAVVWHKGDIHDPDPGVNGLTKLEDYDVEHIFPMGLIDPHWQAFRRVEMRSAPLPQYVTKWRERGAR